MPDKINIPVSVTGAAEAKQELRGVGQAAAAVEGQVAQAQQAAAATQKSITSAAQIGLQPATATARQITLETSAATKAETAAIVAAARATAQAGEEDAKAAEKKRVLTGHSSALAVALLGVPIGRIDSVDFGLGESRGARGPYTPSRLVNYSVAQETAGVAVIRLALGPRAGRERWVRAMVTLRGSGMVIFFAAHHPAVTGILAREAGGVPPPLRSLAATAVLIHAVIGPIDLTGVTTIGLNELSIQQGRRYAMVVVEPVSKRVPWVGWSVRGRQSRR
jgi:hypothetical protein